MKTVITPVKINAIVAIIDLIENLLIPHIPCPEVHPPLIRVPIPTKNPAIKTKIKELVISKLTVDCVK